MEIKKKRQRRRILCGSENIIYTGVWFKYIYISSALTQEKWNTHNISELFSVVHSLFLQTQCQNYETNPCNT